MAADTSNSLAPLSKKLNFTTVQVQPMARKHESISLLPAERLLRQLLLDCRNAMLLSNPGSSKLEIWFTGGWVRDKLLGIQSSDIDVALSTMTGTQFGQALKEFFSQNSQYSEEAQKLGIPAIFKDLHKIAQRPDKSKHLETSTAHVFGLDIDLVNLRKETYAQDSRNPQVEFGTVEEDASRRDITINALYYNLDMQRIEDFTGKGLQDLTAGIIRTPLEPYQTFMDDPLRVLRVIRFASKLDFTVDEEVMQCMKDERVHTALTLKISRERVGNEVFKMMNGRNPLLAFQFIYETDLYSKIFLPPNSQLPHVVRNLLPHYQVDGPWPPTWPHAYQTLAILLEDTTSLGKELAQSEAAENCWTMVAYAPIAGSRTNLERAVREVTSAIKPTNKTSKLLEDALKHMDEIRLIVDLVAAHDPATGNLPRSTVGMAMKSWGATWKLQVLYSLLAEVVCEEASEDLFAAWRGRYLTFVDYVLEQKLQGAFLIKPILNGDDIKAVFNTGKAGAFIKTVLDGVVRWQFDNRGGSREEALEWLRTQKDVFYIP